MKKVLSLILLVVSMAFSYSYTAFSLMTGEKTFAVNPYVYADGKGFIGHDLFLAYGVTDAFDLWTNYTIQKNSDYTRYSDFSVMARVALSPSNILAVRAGTYSVTPQYHFIWENDHFGMQGNIAGQMSYDYMKEPAFYGIFCPLLKIPSISADVYCEVNPGYYMHDGDLANLCVRSKGFGLDVVPGIGFSIGSSLFSVACPIYDVTNSPIVTFGVWWFFTITSSK